MSSIFSAVPIDNLPDAARCYCPNPPTPSDVIDWATASHYLNHGQWLYARTLANNTRLLRLVHGHIAVRLHSSVVVVYPRPGHQDAQVAALFSLVWWNADLTRRRIMAHTPGAFTLLPGMPSQALLRRPLDHDVGTCTTSFGDTQIVWLNDHGGIVKVSSCWPLGPEDFHPKAKRPYRTRRKRGGKKQTVAHFTGGDKEWGQLLQSQIISQETAYEFASQPKPPSSPQVDGEKVRHTLGQAIPDMDRWVRCPEPIPTFNNCRELHSLATLLIHLNDTHKWTREDIADWLESTDLDLEFRPPPAPDPPATYTPF